MFSSWARPAERRPSAAARAARELDAARTELVAAARDLGAAGLAGASLEALQSLESRSEEQAGGPLSPIDRAELEDRVMEWLDDQGADGGLAYPLMERGLTVADLEAAARSLDAGPLGLVLRYLAADRTVRALLADVSSKAALKNVVVELSVEADLPTVEASVADLNQVWMHLVDNAIDAVGESGRIAIDARRDRQAAVVRIIDDGPGIPEEWKARVFEPFFTTKNVGEGRGLGLDVVRSVVLSHRGTVDLSSIPGRTEFRVALPACDAERPGR